MLKRRSNRQPIDSRHRHLPAQRSRAPGYRVNQGHRENRSETIPTSNEVTQRIMKAVAAKLKKNSPRWRKRAIIHDVEREAHAAPGTDSKPCAFCAMLGQPRRFIPDLPDGTGLYRSDAFKAANSRFIGDGKFKAHDCAAVAHSKPVRARRKIRLPGIGDRLAEQGVAAKQPDSFKGRRWWIQNYLDDLAL